MKAITIFTDGACSGNPGKGGWSAILHWGSYEKAISGGFRLTTNNRMEITAAIIALESIKEACQVTLYTDSLYLRNAVEKKWLAAWIANGWKTSSKKAVRNQDLWQRLQKQLERHKVTFQWVRGHAGHAENERCDELARIQTEHSNLPEDTGYVPG